MSDEESGEFSELTEDDVLYLLEGFFKEDEKHKIILFKKNEKGKVMEEKYNVDEDQYNAIWNICQGGSFE